MAIRAPKTLEEAVRRATELIVVGESRALATDGPVSHFRDELNDTEWRTLWLCLQIIKERLNEVLPARPEPSNIAQRAYAMELKDQYRAWNWLGMDDDERSDDAIVKVTDATGHVIAQSNAAWLKAVSLFPRRRRERSA